MKKTMLMVGLAAVVPTMACASGSQANTYSFADNWPTHYVFDDGTDVGLAFKYQYDAVDFSHDDGQFPSAHTARRKELGFYIKKKGVYDAAVGYDYQGRQWLDTYVRVQSAAVFGRDAGAFRVGFTKTPVGFEGNTGSGATTFLEVAPAEVVGYAGRRTGVDWALQRPHYLIDAGYYRGGDLNGDNDGTMVAARFAWVPHNAPGDVWHLGLSASRETPEWTTDGRGDHVPPSARFRSRPAVALIARQLVDSGALAYVDTIDRRGAEALWIDGPWSLQGEYLDTRVAFTDQRPAYRLNGYYAFASWVVTGESRPYSGGNVGNIKPKGPYGAFELALRYSQIDLDDSPVLGGREHDWTLGANWYINKYLKLQANYVRVHSTRSGRSLDPNVTELRAQIQF